MTGRIRIVSDLHVGHKASLLSSLSALRSLADGVDWLILNGDTLELKYGDLDSSHYDAQLQRQLFNQEIASWRANVSVITGNHDPEISNTHFLNILENQVFITHGDCLFHDIAPWSSNIDNLRLCSESIDPHATGHSMEDLHAYMCQHKKVTLDAHKLDKKYNPTLWGKLKIFLHQAWPPTTPFKILRCWREVPDRAVSLTARFGLNPKFIVVGHTHNPGIWTRRDQTIINLGSYFPWPGAYCIDIDGEQLAVKRVSKKQNRIRVGKTLRSFRIRSAAVQPTRQEAGNRV